MMVFPCRLRYTYFSPSQYLQYVFLISYDENVKMSTESFINSEVVVIHHVEIAFIGLGRFKSLLLQRRLFPRCPLWQLFSNNKFQKITQAVFFI